VIVDLTRLLLPGGWHRRHLDDEVCIIEACDPADELVIPLDVSGRQTLRLDFFTYAHRRASSMQVRLTSQDIWRRVRPMRFIFDDRDAVQPAETDIIDVQPGDALHILTQPTNWVALAGITLAPAATSDSAPMGEKQVGFVHDTNMSFSKYAVKQPEDVYSILQPYVDSHVTHVFFGTGVGTYSPLYDSSIFGWHGQEQQEFRADHRARTAGVVRMLREASLDPLAMAVEYAHAHGLQLWANHRISKNHEHDFRHDFPGGRFLIEHRDKLVLERSGEPHHQTIVSHAYPEIREVTVQMLVDQARYSVDGLYIDFLRKGPLVGWEPRSVEDFTDRHGFGPRESRFDGFDMMWFEHLCTYPTQLLRDLRAALEPVEQELGRRVRIATNVRGGWRFTDGLPVCKTEGLDPFTWAQEGLVDVIIPGHDLWLTQQCLDRYTHHLVGTDCELWGAIGPRLREVQRSWEEIEALGENDYADTDPWRYLQAAHDFYSQGTPGVAVWESQDIPSVPQIWNAIRHRIGSLTELDKTFGNRLGRFDGSDKFERKFIE
jgi:hypothetical protein